MSASNFEKKGDCRPSPTLIQISGAPQFPSGHWINGKIATGIGDIPRISTRLQFRDRLGSWKVRWGIGRMKYAVVPGLYAVGNPNADSPVFVSANYKMSFDCLRSRLNGRDGWILVLDTKAVNVWCSAGKGTFGTDELIRRIGQHRLKDIVSHNRLILPQLSATGVNSFKVKAQTGFRVVFGPVRADDLPAFLDAGLKATPEMRRVHFPLKERVVLVPIEIVGVATYALPLAFVLALLSGLGSDGYSLNRLLSYGPVSALLLAIAWIMGSALTPALLPFLPGKAFAAKGAWAGVILVLIMGAVNWPVIDILPGWCTIAAWILLYIAIASFMGMNFTGSSTYTSLSGVQKEMKIAVPLQIIAAGLGFGLWITGLFV